MTEPWPSISSGGCRRRTFSPPRSARASRLPSSAARPTPGSRSPPPGPRWSPSSSRRHERVLFVVALVLAGLWWGSVRLATLDASVLEEEIGRAALARVEVTGPARRSEFAVRVPVRVLRFGRVELHERARLDLPPERSPPQGAQLEVVVTVGRPRGPETEGGFDEAAYLRRQGIHVVLRGGSFRVVGHRGGLGAVADGLRRGVARVVGGGPARRAQGGPCRGRPGRGRGARPGAARQLQGVGPLPPARRLGPERRLRRRRDDPPGVDPGVPALDRGGRGPGCGLRLRPRGGLAALRRAGGGRRRPRLARLARLAPARPLVLPARRRGRAARVEPVQPARARVPALVRGRRRHLRARSPNRGAGSRATRSRRSSPASSRSPPRVAPRPLPSSGCTSGRSPSTRSSPTPWRRQLSRRSSASRSPPRLSIPPCPRPPVPSPGSTAGWPRTSQRALASSAGCRMPRSSRVARFSASSARRACSSCSSGHVAAGPGPQPPAPPSWSPSPSPGRVRRGTPRRSRTDCGSPCSTSARATRSCCRSRRAPFSSTRARRRRTSPASSKDSASNALQRSSSPIPSATTSAAPPTCSRSSMWAPCSTHASRPRARTTMPPQRPPGRATCPSSPPAQASDCGWGRYAWRCSGRTARALRATIRTTTRSSCSRATDRSTRS